jgi:choline dehydrogenase-like flavoprotein
MMPAQNITQLIGTVVAGIVSLMLWPSGAAAQSTPASRDESAGVGVVAGAGYPGSAIALRLSVPADRRVALLIDVGPVRPRDPAVGKTLVDGHVNIRADDPRSGLNRGYVVVGFMHITQPPTATEIRFPNQPPVFLYNKVSGWTFQFGYGYDRQSRHGIRAAFEIVGGINGKSGTATLFARTALGWSRPARP